MKINSIEQWKDGILELNDQELARFEAVRDSIDLQKRVQQIKAGGGGKAGALVQVLCVAVHRGPMTAACSLPTVPRLSHNPGGCLALRSS